MYANNLHCFPAMAKVAVQIYHTIITRTKRSIHYPVHYIAVVNAGSITVAGCANEIGNYFPPLIIFKTKCRIR